MTGCGDFSLCSKRQKRDVAPSASVGSLGAYAPRDDKKGSVPRDDRMEAVVPSPSFLSPREKRGMPRKRVENPMENANFNR
jgi:hypothetical protein